MLGGWDEALFRWINGGWASPALDPVFWFFSLGIKGWFLRIALAALGLFLLFYRSATRITVLASIVAVVLANEICDLAKWLHFAARPAAVLDDVRVLGNLLTSSGTFSAHSANMAAVAAVFWWRLGWKWGLSWALVALLTGLSRVYVGAHFPSQVMLGWMAGALCGVLVAWVVRRIVQKHRRS